ncbi:MAG: hypothetical protein ACRC01_01985, partial [Deefgea sp.]
MKGMKGVEFNLRLGNLEVVAFASNELLSAGIHCPLYHASLIVDGLACFFSAHIQLGYGR